MAPAPGPGHPENDDDIQAPAPTPTPTPAMTSSQDRHENGASPTPMYWNSYPTYPSSLLSSYPTPTATYTITAYLNGMNAVVVVDAAGKTWQAYTSAYSGDGGSHSNTYSSPSPWPSYLPRFHLSRPALLQAVQRPPRLGRRDQDPNFRKSQSIMGHRSQPSLQ
ncbi:hypothetical protein Vi05172_g7043 [Venturia inaequalis]|nr:hypothetical protein Vi05172_g7043 [Venturia inaequalis]